MKAIQALVSAAEKLVDRPVAANQAEAERWLNDPALYMNARTHHVRTLPTNIRPLALEALAGWGEKEATFLKAVGYAKQEFLETARCNIEGITPPAPPGANPAVAAFRRDADARWFGEQNASSHTVPNVDWVNAFVQILPLADPKNARTYRSVGKMMAAIMFYEAKLKWPESVDRFRNLWRAAGDV